MKITQNLFNKILKKNFLFESQPEIAVAVSGGPDSMCLLFLLKEWIIKHNGIINILIIDHNIRKESKFEAAYIKEYLKNLKINSTIIKVNKKKISKKTMNEARINRYEKLINFCKKKKILHLFLGHHLDDNLETFLIRKLSGSNLVGLRSIQNKFMTKNLQILRPLLVFKKKEILEYNNNFNIEYIKDPSNNDINYTRVAVRNFLNNNKNYKKLVIKDFDYLVEIYPKYKKMIFHIFNKIIVRIDNKMVSLDIKKLVINNSEVQTKIIEIIYRFLMPQRGPIRIKKIVKFLDFILDNNLKKRNLGGMLAKKDKNYINFQI